MKPHWPPSVVALGAEIHEARAVMIMIHGRNAQARNILELARPLHHPTFRYLAPTAAGNTWYPFSFLTEIPLNEPGISSGIHLIDQLVTETVAQGIPRERVMLLGFSQGACLASEYCVRHASRLGGLVAFSGGLIGPPGTVWNNDGSFDGMPVFLGCSDVDPHIPITRIDETEAVLTRMGAAVTRRIYPGMGHLVNDDELSFARRMMDQVLA
jgi:predicted esterase